MPPIYMSGFENITILKRERNHTGVFGGCFLRRERPNAVWDSGKNQLTNSEKTATARTQSNNVRSWSEEYNSK